MKTVQIDIIEYIRLINYKLAGIHEDKKSLNYRENGNWKPEEDRLKKKLKELESLKTL